MIDCQDFYKFFYKIVLAQAHRDPLKRGVKKLRCFSKKRFEELKRLLKGGVLSKDEPSIDILRAGKIQKGWKGKDTSKRLCKRERFFVTINRREDAWWHKERWAEVYDSENVWGDLRREDEMRLKRLIKG